MPSIKQSEFAKATDMLLKGDFLEEPLAFYLKGVLPPLMIKLIVLRGNRHFTTWNWMKMMLTTEVESQIEPLEWQNDDFRGNWDFTKRNWMEMMLKGTWDRMANWAGTNSPSTRLPVLLVSVLIELRIEVLITCLKLSARGVYLRKNKMMPQRPLICF